MEDEVVRLEAVQYLQGATAHGIASLGFLAVSVGLLSYGAWGLGVVTTVVAYGIALNGLSLYVWDRLQAHFTSRTDSPSSASERTLTPHRLSPETKADLLGGFVMVGSFVIMLGVASAVLRWFGGRTAPLAAIAALAVGNVLALGRSIVASSPDDTAEDTVG